MSLYHHHHDQSPHAQAEIRGAFAAGAASPPRRASNNHGSASLGQHSPQPRGTSYNPHYYAHDQHGKEEEECKLEIDPYQEQLVYGDEETPSTLLFAATPDQDDNQDDEGHLPPYLTAASVQNMVAASSPKRGGASSPKAPYPAGMNTSAAGTPFSSSSAMVTASVDPLSSSLPVAPPPSPRRVSQQAFNSNNNQKTTSSCGHNLKPAPSPSNTVPTEHSSEADDEDEEQAPKDEGEDEDEGNGNPDDDDDLILDAKRIHKNDNNDHISRCEMVLAGLLALMIAVTVIATSVSLVIRNNNNNHETNDANGGTTTGIHTPTTVTRPVRTLNQQEQYELVLSAVTRNPLLGQYAHELPHRLEDVVALHDQVEHSQNHDDVTNLDLVKTLAPSVRALLWLLFDDAQDTDDELVARFALAVLYYSLQGDDWTRADGWLDGTKKLCGSSWTTTNDDDVGKNDSDDSVDGQDGNWYGITCDYPRHINGGDDDAASSSSSSATRGGRLVSHQLLHQPHLDVVELDLSQNNLVGELPPALALIPTLNVLWLDRNKLSGRLDDSGLFGGSSLPHLQFLYLQKNQLSGPIPNTFLENGNNLRTFFLQGNYFSGPFPLEYCPACPGCDSPLLEFGVDCDATPCPCCDVELNCF